MYGCKCQIEISFGEQKFSLTVAQFGENSVIVIERV